jgi:outer membrane protein assembly factor BamB
MRHLIAAVALLGGMGAAGTADWTGFRGPNGQAVAAEKDVPVKWGKKENIRWKADLPGRGLSNPVITGGKVIVTACSGFKQRRLHVLCLDEKTGVKQWERQFTATGNTQCHPTTNMAAPSPVTDGKAVYALFATGDLAALDLDGTLLWYRSLVSDYPDITNQVGLAASPVVHRGVLLLPMDNAGESFAAGLDAKTGKNLWKVPRGRGINWVSPVIWDNGGQPAVVFHSPREMTAYEPATGKVLWSLADGGSSDISSPALGNGLLFVPGREFVALKAGQNGSTPEVVWKSNKLGGSAGASPVFHEGRLYAMTSVGLRCVDAKDGSEKWLQRVQGRFWASPVIVGGEAGGRAYLTAETGKVTVVQLGDQPRILAENDMGQPLLATPALANGAIYLRSDAALHCVGATREK